MNQPDGVSVPGRDPRTRPAKGDRLRNPIMCITADVLEVARDGVWIGVHGIGESFIPADYWPKTWGRKMIMVVE